MKASVSPYPIIAATAGSCIVLALVLLFGEALPKVSFFLLPTLYYIFALLVAIVSFLIPFGSRGMGGLSIAAMTLCVLVGVLLILVQGVPTRWLAWGRFPLGDASDFLSSAVVLIQTGEFVSIRGRPLSNGYIAGLWRTVGFDLAVLSVVTSLFCAVAFFFYTRVVLTCLGIAGGSLAFAITGDFLHEHLASASTEPIGFFVGAAAVTLLMAGAYQRALPIFAIGMGTLVFAFMLRAGALFMVPALFLFPFFLAISTRQRLIWFGAMAIAGAVAMSLHLGAVKTYTPTSPGFVNAPKSWYAIIAMGDEALGERAEGSVRDEARWLQIFDDHPGLYDMPIDQQGRKFVEIVKNAALDRPLSVLAGTALEYSDQILRAGLFRFVDNKPIRAIVFGLFGLGLLFSAFRARRDPLAALFLLAGLGQLSSIPFLHGGENRVHIATGGMMAATAGYAISVMLAAFRQGQRERSRRIGAWIYGVTILPGVALVFAVIPMFLPPLAISTAGNMPLSCEGDKRSILSAAGNGSVVVPSLTAREEWLDIVNMQNLFLYAPITSAAVPLPRGNMADGSRLIYVAQFSDRKDALGIGATLMQASGEENLTAGLKTRCLLPY